MKKTSFLLAAIMLVPAAVRSQDGESPALSRPAAARILGEIPDGTPPPPSPPKPKFIVPAKDVLATTSQQQGGRTITFQKIKPIALPSPPEPATPVAPIDAASLQDRLAEARESHQKSNMIMLGATVYHFKDSPPRTLVTYWPEGAEESITFWSSADFSLISGISSFVATDGATCSLFMMWSNQNVARMADLFTVQSREYHGPNMPDFSNGSATFSIFGKQPNNPSVLVPIQSLHDIYNSEYRRLKTAYEGRERARLQREAYLKANPPRPKNITLNYWRTEKPAPVKGASR